MIVVPFIEAHLEGMKLHKWMIGMEQHLGPEYGALLSMGPGFSGITDGKILCSAGVIQLSETRWQAWGLMTQESGPNMKAITREVKGFLDRFNAPRVETPVLRDFELGHKWMRMLGFENETPNGMINYGDAGETYDLYARIKK